MGRICQGKPHVIHRILHSSKTVGSSCWSALSFPAFPGTTVKVTRWIHDTFKVSRLRCHKQPDWIFFSCSSNHSDCIDARILVTSASRNLLSHPWLPSSNYLIGNVIHEQIHGSNFSLNIKIYNKTLWCNIIHRLFLPSFVHHFS